MKLDQVGLKIQNKVSSPLMYVSYSCYRQLSYISSNIGPNGVLSIKSFS